MRQRYKLRHLTENNRVLIPTFALNKFNFSRNFVGYLLLACQISQLQTSPLNFNRY